MLTTTTVTKAAGAILGAFLFFLLAGWAGAALFAVGGGEHGAEEEGEAVAMMTAAPGGVGGESAGAATAEAAPAVVLGEGDAAKGEKVFGKCKACHKLDSSDGTGPHLNGVVDRAVASVGGFGYSDGMKAHAAEAPTWTPEALQEFLTNPKSVVKGTKMAFAGLPKPEERANLIAYLAANP